MNKLNKVIVFSLLFFFIPIKPVFSFGSDGHEIIAEVAMIFLTPETKEKIIALFGKDSIVDIANVADQIKFIRPNTSPWHFIQIPLSDKEIDRTKEYWNNGNNLLQKIEDCISVIETGKPVPNIKTKKDAIMFMVHLIGDVHQPLHCSNNDDKGGNLVSVKFLTSNAKNNLHHVWDTQLIQLFAKNNCFDNKQYAAMLVSHMSQEDKDKYSVGSIQDWVLESHLLNSVTYLKNGDRMDDEYVKKSTIIVNEQLLKAGVRLAKILNERLK